MRRALPLVAVAALLAAGIVVVIAARSPSGSEGRYLALGDSITFGYRDVDSRPAPHYADPATFVGFPTLVGRAEHLQVTDLSCPGETSASYFDADPDNACWHPKTGYRTEFPLHVRYRGPQAGAAAAFLRAHVRSTHLVTLLLGLNDLTACLRGCPPEDVAPALRGVTTRLRTAIGDLRSTGYRGPLLVLGYYDAVPRPQLIERIDAAIAAATTGSDARYVPTVAAFGPHPCTDALLDYRYRLHACGLHPTPAGTAILARTVEAALLAAPS